MLMELRQKRSEPTTFAVARHTLVSSPIESCVEVRPLARDHKSQYCCHADGNIVAEYDFGIGSVLVDKLMPIFMAANNTVTGAAE